MAMTAANTPITRDTVKGWLDAYKAYPPKGVSREDYIRRLVEGLELTDHMVERPDGPDSHIADVIIEDLDSYAA
jgi:hypothetical protein